MSISKIAMLSFGMMILASSVLISNPVYAPSHIDGGTVPTPPGDMTSTVGGLPTPINESEVFGELAQQYSLWVIPAISAIVIATYLVKRKF